MLDSLMRFLATAFKCRLLSQEGSRWPYSCSEVASIL